MPGVLGAFYEIDAAVHAIEELKKQRTGDITVYTPNANLETMFELPRYVIKSGRIIVEQGEIREETSGKTLHVAPAYDRGVEPDIQKWFEESYSIQWRNYPVEDGYVHDREVIATRR